MVLLWLWQRRSRNAAIVDVGWTAALGLLGVAYAVSLPGTVGRRWLIGGMVGIWSARLVAHLLRDRIVGQPEEGRYKALRDYWGDRAQPYLLLFFLGQAVLACLLALAFVPGLVDTRPTFDGWDIAAAVLWIVAWSGETLADRQLYAFKADPANKGRVCDTGLWGWSRHPNYFFEWLMWIAFVLPGLPHPAGPYALLAPLLMLILVVKVSGIPTSEKQCLRSRGDAYRAYQRRVSPFLPLPPRKESSA